MDKIITIAIAVVLSVGLSVGGMFLFFDTKIGPEGPAGPAGEQGIQGPVGPQGPAGEDGTSIMPNGVWQTFCFDGGVIKADAFWCKDTIEIWSK